MTTWTFGAGGIYTATWDGINTLTITMTSGGAFVASFSGQSLADLTSSPQFLTLAYTPPPALIGLTAVVSTPNAGFALQNGTPNILTWAVPSDGNVHTVMVTAQLFVGSTMTGGRITLNFQDSSGNTQSRQIFAGGEGAGYNPATNPSTFIVSPGQNVVLSQNSALTAGSATCWAQIWGL